MNLDVRKRLCPPKKWRGGPSPQAKGSRQEWQEDEAVQPNWFVPQKSKEEMKSCFTYKLQKEGFGASTWGGAKEKDSSICSALQKTKVQFLGNSCPHLENFF